MVDEEALQRSLVTLAGLARAQYSLTVGLATRIQALEETLGTLDPNFSRVMATKAGETDIRIGMITLEALTDYDDLIDHLKRGEGC